MRLHILLPHYYLEVLLMLYIPLNEDGQGLVEYALILVLVAIVVIAGLLLFGQTLGNTFSEITNQLIEVSS